MSVTDQESTKGIVSNLLSSSQDARGSEASVMQQQESDCATPDLSTRDRNRKLAEKGKEYLIETLRHHRDAANKRLTRQIKKVNSSLDELQDIELLTSEAEELDLLKDLNHAFKQYHDLMENEEDREASYQCSDLIDREFSECRLRISSRIHAIERKVVEEKSPVKFSQSVGSFSTKSSSLSGSSARSRKIKAAARAAKLEAQMKFLDKEAELKKLMVMKELAMAKAERDAMEAIENEDNRNTAIQEPGCQAQSSLNQDALPFIAKETLTPLPSQEHCLPLESKLQEFTPLKPFTLPPHELPLPPVKSEPKTYDRSNPFSPMTLQKLQLPVKREPQSAEVTNTEASSAVESQVQIAGSSPSEVVLQEIIKLQAKQTELSSLIAEQQRISSLPVQEPPTFSGSYFDYPVFMRAFETIIEARALADRERLYFLNNYTSGKDNDVIKGFVTLNSSDSFQTAKKLLAQRFGDPHRVSDACKTHLRKWPQINEGHTSDLQVFSDFLVQCKEVMKSMKFLSDLDSTEVLRLVS